MKILLDECVTKSVRNHLVGLEVLTVREQGWLGFKNGTLMSHASNSGFNIFLTIDKNLQYQQNISDYKLAVVILDSPSSKIEKLLPFVTEFLNKLADFQPGKAYVIQLSQI